MVTAQIVETVTLPNLLSDGMSHQFLRCFTLALMIGTLMLAGCATSGGPDKSAESSPGVVVSEAQAGEAAPKATEKYGASTTPCAVVGAIIGGAIGIAAAAPTCNPITGSVCPMAILLVGGSMAVVGGAVGTYICRERTYP